MAAPGHRHADIAAARRVELSPLAERMPVVFRHGDHATRNWLYDPAHGSGMIDFETAADGITTEEFVWFYGAV